MKPLHLVCLPIAVLLLACNVTKRKPEVFAARDRPIELKPASPLSIDPCALCVGFSATKAYSSGSIRWLTCRNRQAKVYLDIRLTKPGNPELKLRLLRACHISTPEGQPISIDISYLKCSAEGNADLLSIVTHKFEATDEGNVVKSIGFSFLWGNEGKIFEATMSSSALSGIYIKEGWQMHYANGKACKM